MKQTVARIIIWAMLIIFGGFILYLTILMPCISLYLLHGWQGVFLYIFIVFISVCVTYTICKIIKWAFENA